MARSKLAGVQSGAKKRLAKKKPVDPEAEFRRQLRLLGGLSVKVDLCETAKKHW
jgi:hypothetical protein